MGYHSIVALNFVVALQGSPFRTLASLSGDKDYQNLGVPLHQDLTVGRIHQHLSKCGMHAVKKKLEYH